MSKAIQKLLDNIATWAIMIVGLGIVGCCMAMGYTGSTAVVHLLAPANVTHYVRATGGNGVLVGVPAASGEPAGPVALGKLRGDATAYARDLYVRDARSAHALAAAGRVFTVRSGRVTAERLAGVSGVEIHVRLLSGSHSGAVAWVFAGCLQRATGNRTAGAAAVLGQ